MRDRTTLQRSQMMASIRAKDTWPELTLRRFLFARGFRYRLHVREIPGSPDLVFPRYSAVVFVHGCFWHRHQGCRYATTPQRNNAFWMQKFQKNIERDRRAVEESRKIGWRVAIVWECSLKESVTGAGLAVEAWLRSDEKMLIVSASVRDGESR